MPNFEITEQFFDMKIREYIHRYNYTYNPDGIYRAIKYMYTYWPDPKNTTHIREEYIDVSFIQQFGNTTKLTCQLYNVCLIIYSSCPTHFTNHRVTA